MHIHIHQYILASISAFVLICTSPLSVSAAESTSFRLYENNDTADSISLGSTSFSLNEAGETWTGLPITSSNFQIVTAPPAVESGTSGGGGGGPGQHRNDPEPGSGGGSGGGTGGQETTSSSSSSEESVATTSSSSSTATTQSSSAPAESSQSSAAPVPDVPLDANISDQPTEPSAPTAPSAPSGDSTGGTTTVVSRPLTEDEQLRNLECGCVCQACPVQEQVRCSAQDRIIKVPMPVPVFAQNPVPSLLMLMAAFGLGYFGKSFRPGSAQVTAEKKKKPTKRKKK